MHVPEGNGKEPMVSMEAVRCETSFVEKTALDKLDEYKGSHSHAKNPREDFATWTI